MEYICSEFQSRLLSSQGLAKFSTDSETYVILVSCLQQNIKISQFHQAKSFHFIMLKIISLHNTKTLEIETNEPTKIAKYTEAAEATETN